MILQLVSTLLSAVTFAGGLIAMLFVKTDVGVLCSVLVIQCGWIILLLSRIAGNTAKRFP